MLKIINLLFATILLLISACGTTFGPNYGVIKQNDFQDVFMSGLSDQQQEILFYSRAFWYPNKNGFKLIPAGKKSQKGVFVITDKGLYFSKWSSGEKNYKAVLDIKFEEIEIVRDASNELFGRIVVKKGDYNSFELLGVEGPELPSKDQTDIAYKLLLQLSKS